MARYREPACGSDAHSRAAPTSGDELLGTVQVETPDEQLDLMVNGQALYQATACRLWGRTATYQSSGAYGFRDQLQDCLALLIARPDLVREQIVEASRHQFPEGDVLHWWQPFSGRGVRTHISDDRHWLPLVVAEYLAATGDTSVLDELTAFIEGPLLPLEDEDAYLQPAISEQAATVYEHCVRALESGRPVGVARTAAHGRCRLVRRHEPRRPRRQGRERVARVVPRSTCSSGSRRCASRAATPTCADDYRAWAARLAAAVEETSWDGAWYRRAYFDDGTPLGTHDGRGVPHRRDRAGVGDDLGRRRPEARRDRARLGRGEARPPRRRPDRAARSPVRPAWPRTPATSRATSPASARTAGSTRTPRCGSCSRTCMRGDGDEAAALLDLINPINHSLTREAAEHYVVEPYVVAADVYAAAPHTGRGGWTWYTGSASWFYRVALQWMLGLRVVADDGRPLARGRALHPQALAGATR